MVKVIQKPINTTSSKKMGKNADGKYIPKVSVIIPVYNVEKYLRECLDSVVNQTLKDIEIICINDGSTDGSLEILKEYAQKDNRIKIIDQKNQGLGAARNNGVLNATGKYIFFIDSDDWLDLSGLEILYDKITKTNSDICIYGLQKYDEKKNEFIQDSYYDTSCYKIRKHEVCDFKEISSVIFRRFGSVMKMYNLHFFLTNNLFFPENVFFEDVVTHVKSVVSATSISFVDQNLYFYRINRKDSIMSTAKDNPKVFDILIALKTVGEFLSQKNVINLLKKEYLEFVTEQINFHSNRILNTHLKQQFDFEVTNFKNTYLRTINNILISIIVPVYNVEKYLRECLDSICNQTLKEIEIICVDDCSTDNSLKILQEYANTDKRITIIKNIINEKQGAARNKALKIARGEYVQFVDSDDCLELDACEILYNRCHMYNIDIMNFAGANFDTKTREVTQLSGQRVSYIDCDKIYKGYEIDGFRYNVPVSACRFFYRRKFLVDHDISFPVGLFFEDNVFVRRAMLFVECFGGIDKILYNRRVHSESTTQNTDKHFGDYIKIIQIIADMYGKEHVPVSKLRSVMQMYCNTLFSRYILFSFEQRNKYYVEFYNFLKTMIKKYALNQDEFSYRKRLEEWCKKRFGYSCLDNPKTFNEKIQWSKIYDSTPIKTRLADKYLVRDWVAKKIGKQYLIPLLGVYDSFEEIDFDKLPKQFVIKTNHGSGTNIIVKDKSKLDLADVKAKLDKWMNENFAFKCGYELHYRDIPRKIIIEKYMEDESGDLQDYKVLCFGGKPEFIWVDTDRYTDHKRNFFDLNWKEMNIKMHPKYGKKENIPAPKTLCQMIEFAQKLSSDFNMVRVDFYEIKGKLYFGEMTFTSSSGTEQIVPASFDRYLGKLYKLPEKAYNVDTGEYYKYKFHSQLWCLLHSSSLTHFIDHIKDIHFIKHITSVHPIKHFWRHIKDMM